MPFLLCSSSCANGMRLFRCLGAPPEYGLSGSKDAIPQVKNRLERASAHPDWTTTDNDPRGELPNAPVRDGRLEVCISGLDIVGYAIQLGSNPYCGRNGHPESIQSSRNSVGSRDMMCQKFRFATQLKSSSRLVPEPESGVTQRSIQTTFYTGPPVALPGWPPQSSGRVMALIPAPRTKARPCLA
ncbi:hypothetical protein NMY22_g262 [Coprinellus aureogranulatus]|nr:hypothetical protein NMY22_g262 [Coprinellus aureogranulatus]